MTPRPGDMPDSAKEGSKKPFDYTSHEVKFLINNLKGAEDFLHATNNYGGASINLTSGKVIQPGEKVYLVGKEPSKLSGHPVPTEFESAGTSSPKLNLKQFASHFLRLKEHATDSKAVMGSWVDSSAKEKGVQIDLSTGHKYKKTAERKMIARNEDAVWNMHNMRNIRNEAARKRHGITEPRPPKAN